MRIVNCISILYNSTCIVPATRQPHESCTSRTSTAWKLYQPYVSHRNAVHATRYPKKSCTSNTSATQSFVSHLSAAHQPHKAVSATHQPPKALSAKHQPRKALSDTHQPHKALSAAYQPQEKQYKAHIICYTRFKSQCNRYHVHSSQHWCIIQIWFPSLHRQYWGQLHVDKLVHIYIYIYWLVPVVNACDNVSARGDRL